MKQIVLKENVYEAFQQRLSYIIDYFDHIIISFSGGKDSGLMLELVHQYYESHHLKTSNLRISVFHLDYEGNYEMTREYVNRCMGKFKKFNYYHICLPISASSGVSMYHSTWLPWDPNHPELWVSSIPKGAISLENHNLPFFEIGMSDYEFQTKFCQWLHQETGAKRTAILVGIRAQESLNRYNAIMREDTFSRFGTISYSHSVAPNVFNFYPMYDWLFKDIWTANYKFSFDYNHLYDLFFQAGVPYKFMRVANPFHQCAVSSLNLYKVIDPNSWGKLVGRVNGANFSSIYGKTSAVGFRSATLPFGHTWKSYVEFLLNTLPKETRNIYNKKFMTSLNYWTVRGGALPTKVVNALGGMGLKFQRKGLPENNRKYTQPYEIIRFNEYPDDVDVKYFRLVPSYKRMCITILKNDTSCQYMGFSQTKDELQKKKDATEKWKKLL